MSERAWVGAEFFKLPEEKQKMLLATGNMLFCRTEPKDKQRLVKMLQDMGEVGWDGCFLFDCFLTLIPW